jgi:Protein of unknown function (DUF3617)
MTVWSFVMKATRIPVRAIRVVAAAVAGLSAAAFAAGVADLPVLKSGLWEVTRASTQQNDSKHLTTMCLDESVQAEMREFSLGVAKEMCSQNDRKVEGNRMTVSATCKLGPTTMTTHSVMVFTGNSSYHTTATAHYDPPFMNMTDTQSTVDGKWVGACKPGQQPGDIVTETGQKINMKSMMKK